VEHIQAKARKLFEDAWNLGNTEAARELMAPQCRFHDGALPWVEEGVDSYLRHISACREAFPDLAFSLEEITTDSKAVTVRWVARGTHRHTFLGVRPTHRRVRIEGKTICRFDEGRIVELETDWNLSALLEQLGAEEGRLASGVGFRSH
jgi:steroid delta-isomerase-like uncharacterized protein